MIISKTKFIDIINTIKQAHDFEEECNALARKYDRDYDCFPWDSYVEQELVDLLETIMEDDAGDISYFIYELNFGSRYVLGAVTLPDGTKVDFSSANSLYDYLASKYNGGWIKTKDKVPELLRDGESEPIIFQTLDKIQIIGYYGESDRRGYFRSQLSGDIWGKIEIPAWRPRPEPYEINGKA